MVTQVIDGKEYIVPQLYLANEYERPNGAYIGGNNVDLEIKEAVTNAGTIYANESLSLRADTITNQFGTIKSGGTVQLDATGDIVNNSGTIEGSSVRVTSKDGNIINETLTTVNIAPNGTLTTTVHKIANITATNGPVVLDAGNDIYVRGADITSTNGGVSLQAGHDVTIETIKNEILYDLSHGTGDIVTHKQSNITADTFSIIAGNNANLESANLNADNIFIQADNLVTNRLEK